MFFLLKTEWSSEEVSEGIQTQRKERGRNPASPAPSGGWTNAAAPIWSIKNSKNEIKII